VLSKYHNGIYKTYQYLSSLLHIDELTAVHGAAVPFSVMTKYFTPRAGCYCSSRHKHGQLASYQLHGLVRLALATANYLHPIADALAYINATKVHSVWFPYAIAPTLHAARFSVNYQSNARRSPSGFLGKHI
jgi:hypothetical protein